MMTTKSDISLHECEITKLFIESDGKIKIAPTAKTQISKIKRETLTTSNKNINLT